MEDFLYKNKKGLAIFGVIVVVLIIGAFIFKVVWEGIYSAKINVRLAPSIAKLVIDDKEYSFGEHRIKPGTYEVKAVAEGFISKTGKLVAVADETTDILLYLEPTEDNANWYAEHPMEATALGDIKNDYAHTVMEKFIAENPKLKTLPIEIDYFTSDRSKRVKYSVFYQLNEDFSNYSFVITDYTGGNYDDAIEKLKARGLELDGHEIEYVDESESLEWGHAE